MIKYIKFFSILILLQVIHAQNTTPTPAPTPPATVTTPTPPATETTPTPAETETTPTPPATETTPTPAETETTPTPPATETTPTPPAPESFTIAAVNASHKPTSKPVPKPNFSPFIYNCTDLHDHPDQLKIIGVHKNELILMASFKSAFKVPIGNLYDSSLSLPASDETLGKVYPKLWADHHYKQELRQLSSGLITDKQLLFFAHGGNATGIAFDLDKRTVSDGLVFPADVVPISTSSEKFYGIKNGPQVMIADYIVESGAIHSNGSNMPICLVNDSIVFLAEGECHNSSFKGTKPFQEEIFAGFVWKNYFYLFGHHVYKFSTNCTKHHLTKVEQFSVKYFIDCANNALLLWLVFLLLILFLLICCISVYCCRDGKNPEHDKQEAFPDKTDGSSQDTIRNEQSKPIVNSKPNKKSKSNKTKGSGREEPIVVKSNPWPKEKDDPVVSQRTPKRSHPKSRSQPNSKNEPELKQKSDDLPVKSSPKAIISERTPNFATAAATKSQPKSNPNFV